MTDRTQALLAALSVALTARSGELNDRHIALMTSRAGDLPQGDPLRAAIHLFEASWRSCRRDPEAVMLLGEELQRGVERASRPDAPDGERRDIHG